MATAVVITCFLRPLHFAGPVQEGLQKLIVEAKPKEAREPRLKDAEATLDKLPDWDRKAFSSHRFVDNDDDDEEEENEEFHL